MGSAHVRGVHHITLTQGEQAVRRSVDRAEQDTRRVAQREHRWLVPLGRAGYAANGLVYIVVGCLAAQAALGVGGETTDAGGALGHILEAPFGRFALGSVGIGLAGYALWRLLQAIADTEDKGESVRGIVERIGLAIAGISYAGLALSALTMALGQGSQPNQEQAAQDRTALLMSQPFGPWLVGAAGLIVVVLAVAQFFQAYRGSFTQKLREQEMTDKERQWAQAAGRLGYSSRGVAFGVIGMFLLIAGVQARPDQARGLGGALATLSAQPFGPWLLGVVAIGLVAYGFHMLIAARYRRMVL
jgi:hypothetical protein